MTKDEKFFKKFKTKYSTIFNHPLISEALKNHFDNNGSFIAFTLGLVENRIDNNKFLTHLKINKDEWAELFITLYKNQNIIDIYKKLEINPIVPLEQTISSFNCFDGFINQFIEFIKKHEINLNIHESKIKTILKSAYGYLFYNKIDCKLPYNINEIIVDPEYDTKNVVILNNTKLFATVKQQIVSSCGEKINDLIVLLLGLSNKLNFDN